MRGDTTKVLIAGGGVAALEAALALRALAGELVEVELLAPEPQFWYRPMSVAEPFGLGEAQHFDLGDLAAAAGASFTPGALVGVDSARKLARTTNETIEYDALLIAARRPAATGGSRCADLSRPRRHGACRRAAREGRSRRDSTARVRRPGRRRLDAARLRARADDRRAGLGWARAPCSSFCSLHRSASRS